MTTLSSIKKEMANQFPNILRKDINRCVSIIFSEIIEALCGNEFTAVELRGYGRFSTKMQKPYIGRNPKTGAKVNVPSKRVIKFKASSILIKKLNKNFTENEISATN